MNEDEVEEDFADELDDNNLNKLIEIKSELERLLNKVNDVIENW